MKNFFQFLLAAFATLVIALNWPIIGAEIALAVFAVLAVFNESKRIAIIEVLVPIVIIIFLHQKPDWWMVCIVISLFLAVWNMAEGVTVIKEKLK
jgi:hypothetical protein